MATDDTTLPTATGGDVIRTYAITKEDGTVVKIQGVAVTVMQQGFDGRPVVRADPFPVFDEESYDVLLEILKYLKLIYAVLRG